MATMHVTNAIFVGMLSCAVASAQGAQRVEVGAEPEFAFHRPILFGDGVQSLADLRGKPTMIEFWGTH